MTSTIIVDAMGGDNAPAIPVTASIDLCQNDKDLNIILVGREAEIYQHIPNKKVPDNVKITHAAETILMDDSPSVAYRKKTDSSMHKCIELLKEGKGDAFFTAGNTGAAVTISYFTSGLIKNIHRPALSIIYPSLKGKQIVMLDLGATVDVQPRDLRDFAIMGTIFSRCSTGKKDPSVALLSVGEEQLKGKSIVVEAADLIKESLNYHGFIEGNQLFKNEEVDVVVTDGFTGNIVLKTIEGLSETIYALVKQKIEPHRKWIKLSSFLLKHLFSSTFSRFNYTIYGCAVLLGVNHLIGIGHGRSNVSAFKTGINNLLQYVESDFQKKFIAEISTFQYKDSNPYISQGDLNYKNSDLL